MTGLLLGGDACSNQKLTLPFHEARGLHAPGATASILNQQANL
jgi:hypothetical protein